MGEIEVGELHAESEVDVAGRRRGIEGRQIHGADFGGGVEAVEVECAVVGKDLAGEIVEHEVGIEHVAGFDLELCVDVDRHEHRRYGVGILAVVLRDAAVELVVAYVGVGIQFHRV